MRQYASANDVSNALREHYGDDLAVELRNANLRVAADTRSARYAVDSAGYPSDPEVRDAFTLAAVMHLEYWAEAGDSTGAAAASGGGSILGVSLPSGKAGATGTEKQEARSAPAAFELLHSTYGIDWRVG